MLYLIRNSFIIISVFLPAVSLVAQSDWQRWEKSEPNYLKDSFNSSRDYSYQKDNFEYLISKSLINLYQIFISDVDGDNCPFYPSCSSFWIEAIDETNIFQGTLMFFDRFTRDSNPVNRDEHYPVYKNFRYYDPPKLYALKKDKLEFIPPYTNVK